MSSTGESTTDQSGTLERLHVLRNTRRRQIKPSARLANAQRSTLGKLGHDVTTRRVRKRSEDQIETIHLSLLFYHKVNYTPTGV